MKKTKPTCAIGCLFLIPILMLAYPVIFYTSKDDVTFKVKDKERIINGNSSYYLVFTDIGPLKNSDSYLMWKFNSSDVYGELNVGDSYSATCYGWRIPFLDMYKNIDNDIAPIEVE